MDKKKVVAGFSGGVDSCTSAALLLEKGFDVTAVTFIVNEEWGEVNRKYVLDAAGHLKVKHMFFDAGEIFRERVIKSYIDSINDGRSLSVCPLCNEIFKFRILEEIADSEGAYYIATGHYACSFSEGENHYIKRASFPEKDQSYMLYRLGSDLIKRILFPAGFYGKADIRRIASGFDIPVAERADSQGLCFAQSGFIDFIKNSSGIRMERGEFVSVKGEVLGYHDGYQFFTVGQRRGLGVNFNTPVFVVSVVPSENRVVLGSFEELMTDTVFLREYVIHGRYRDFSSDDVFTARPRFSSKGHPASISVENDLLKVSYVRPNAEIAPGQHMVLYDGDIVAGGGIIV